MNNSIKNKKSCHSELVSESMYVRSTLCKKGAMFGLDARIALAIFGALSVITGAALYSAIQNAHAEQWRQHFENIVKATEVYYLDNGKPLDIASAEVGRLHAEDIVINRENLNTWRGPYVSFKNTVGHYWEDSMSEKIHEYSTVMIFLRQKSDWASSDSSDTYCVVNSLDCMEWIGLYAGHADSSNKLRAVFNQLDSLVDGGDGDLKGKVRYILSGNGRLLYQGIPHIRR